jgi:hypothetical protein
MAITLIVGLAGVLAGTSGQEFKVDPLVVPWRPVGYALQAFRLGPAHPNVRATGLSAGPTRSGLVQLRSERTGVTCTMRILEVKPTVDAGIFAPLGAPHPDPIVRSSLSPCVD